MSCSTQVMQRLQKGWYVMQFNLKAEQDEQLRREIEEYDRQQQEYIEGIKADGKEKRKKQDNIFRDLMLGVIGIGFLVCLIMVIL